MAAASLPNPAVLLAGLAPVGAAAAEQPGLRPSISGRPRHPRGAALQNQRAQPVPSFPGNRRLDRWLVPSVPRFAPTQLVRTRALPPNQNPFRATRESWKASSFLLSAKKSVRHHARGAARSERQRARYQLLPAFFRLPTAEFHPAYLSAQERGHAERKRSMPLGRARTRAPSRIPATLWRAASQESRLHFCLEWGRASLRPKELRLPLSSPATLRWPYPLAGPAIRQMPSSNAARHCAFRPAAWLARR